MAHAVVALAYLEDERRLRKGRRGGPMVSDEALDKAYIVLAREA